MASVLRDGQSEHKVPPVGAFRCGSGAACHHGPGTIDAHKVRDTRRRRRTSRVAAAHAGGGRVTGSEEGDHEVEVTLPDGRQVELHLGRDLKASPPRPIRTPGGDRG